MFQLVLCSSPSYIFYLNPKLKCYENYPVIANYLRCVLTRDSANLWKHNWSASRGWRSLEVSWDVSGTMGVFRGVFRGGRGGWGSVVMCAVWKHLLSRQETQNVVWNNQHDRSENKHDTLIRVTMMTSVNVLTTMLTWRHSTFFELVAYRYPTVGL